MVQLAWNEAAEPGATTAPAVSTNVPPDKRDTNSHGTSDFSHPEEQVQVVAWTKHVLYSKTGLTRLNSH
jgi:hypothetical protein